MLNVPLTFVTWACRYCIGRRTYAADDFLDWAFANIEEMGQQNRDCLVRDIQGYTEGHPRSTIDPRWFDLKWKIEEFEE